MRTRLFCLVVFLGGMLEGWCSSAGGPRCDLPVVPWATVRTASNCFYEVSLNDGFSRAYGAFSAGTGPLHPVTLALGERESAIFGQGFSLTPVFSSVSVRSWHTHTDYLFDSALAVLMADGGYSCIPSGRLPTPRLAEVYRDDGQVVGLSSFFAVKEGDDDLGVTVWIEAHGEGFEDSAVEVTTTVQNLGDEDARIGLRYFSHIGILTQSGGAMGLVPPEPPEEPWLTQEREWLVPTFDRWFLSLTDTPSADPLYYFAGASVRGPWTLNPPPTPPDRLVYASDVGGSDPAEKLGPRDVCFQWHTPDPPRGPAHSGGGEAVVYYWGDTEETAIILPPGASTSVTAWVWAFLDNPVTCDAGGPYPPAECSGPITEVALDGTRSYTVEGNPLLYRWSSPDPETAFDDPRLPSPAAVLARPGKFPISLDVGIGPFTRTCETEIEVVDTTPPDLEVPAPVVMRTSEHGPDACALLATLLAEAKDVCWPDALVTHTTYPYLGSGGAEASYFFPPGTTRVIFTAEDPSGNRTTSETRVTVLDDTPPRFTVLETHPALLWPPNHRMAEVLVTAEARDNCDPAPSVTLLEARSSEADDALGDGHTEADIQGAKIGAPDFSVLLRAERNGGMSGRTYTLRYDALDEWGNTELGEVKVLVPHDRRDQER